MKGIVFTKFIEMVEERFSIETAALMIERADVPSGGIYTSVGTYDHSEMVSLITQLSALTGLSVPDLLRTYGRHLFRQFTVLYPELMVGTANSLDFIATIENVIHVEVKKLYPDAELPRFETLEHTPHRLRIVYRSDRHLGDLAHGLIESCVEHFGETGCVQVERHNLQEPGDPVCFVLTRQI